MARIYISSSWRNSYHQQLVQELRENGHQVYDFRHPEGREDNNVWDDLGINKEFITPQEFSQLDNNEVAGKRFADHFCAMNDADTCILLLPCGASSHVEAGYMAGDGKRVFVFCPDNKLKPELMYRVFNGFGFYYRKEDLFAALNTPIPGVCRVCGCTENNPCYHPKYGYCWWVDEDHTLCSHCAEKLTIGRQHIPGIYDDPLTEHCINDIGNGFKFKKHD